jgi:putative hydrolase of the HAD superfamily
MSIRALIFDYGNVLDHVDDPQPWLDKRAAAAAQFNMTADEFFGLLYNTDPWQECKRGRITYKEFWNRILSPLGITDPAAQDEFAAKLYEGRDWINPDMAALIRELKPHYRLAVLSNTFDPEMEYLIAETHGLKDIFDVVISSAKVGLAKPEPEIYEVTLEQLNVAAAEALFIDDMPRNTNAAEALGIPSIVFESPSQLRRELEQRGILPVQSAA